jgi:hypothetical protein
MREAGETGELRYDAPERRILQIRDGEVAGVLNLGNLYSNYRQVPRARRPEYLRACVRTALARHRELPDEFEAARPDLRPRLWARATLEHQRLLKLLGDPGGGEIDAPSESIGEHLLALLAYDWPESVQSIAAENLEGWGATFYEAMEVARQNLVEATQGYVQLGDHLFTFASGDSYDASRLLLIDRIQDLEVAGRTVAMVPNRDSLFITGSEDEVGLTMMIELAARGLEGSYILSGVPLVLEDGTWVDWMPPADHPLHGRFRQIERGWLGLLYFEQKKLLDALH